MIGALTVFSSEGAPLAKRYELKDGKLTKTTAAQLTRGTAEVRTFASIGELAELIEGLSTQEAISASLPADGRERSLVVSQKQLAANPGALARTKRDFGLQARPGLLFLDSDAAEDEALSRDELWSLLLETCPALAEAGVLWRPSGSSHVCNGDEDLTGLRGQHVFVLIADASDGPRVVKALAARLWLLGKGQIKIGESGSLLVRCPIDTAPADAARLIFASGSDCVPPLEQRRGPAVVLASGGFLDSRAVVPDLSAEEAGRWEAAVVELKAAARPAADAARRAWVDRRVADSLPALMRKGQSAAEAEQKTKATLEAAFSGVLLGDFELTVVHDDGRWEAVSVSHVLKHWQTYNETDCLDPENPGHRQGAADARLFLLAPLPSCTHWTMAADCGGYAANWCSSPSVRETEVCLSTKR